MWECHYLTIIKYKRYHFSFIFKNKYFFFVISFLSVNCCHCRPIFQATKQGKGTHLHKIAVTSFRPPFVSVCVCCQRCVRVCVTVAQDVGCCCPFCCHVTVIATKRVLTFNCPTIWVTCRKVKGVTQIGDLMGLKLAIHLT